MKRICLPSNGTRYPSFSVIKFRQQTTMNESKESALNHNKAQFKPLEDISDVNWMALEETASEIRSIASSPMPPKRSSKKLKTSVMPLPPPPRKTPACNGVYLDLTAIGISEFPLDMLDQLSNLRMLYLENNNLLKLPNALFSTLKFLHWIDVRNNKLTDLPSNIAWHPCLETILLQGNEIEKLPLQLCLIPNLKRLQVTRNPLVFPPKNIVDRGSDAVLEYLRTEWKKLHPEATDTSKDVPKDLEKDNDKDKPDFTTILCYEPKSIAKKKKVADQLPDISSLTSKSSSDANSIKKTVRQKSWEYKPSNRNKTALKNWRQDKRSYDNSIVKAGKRTAANIPFAVDLDDYPMHSKQDSKMVRLQNSSQRFKAGGKRKYGLIAAINIDRKVEELFESLSQLQIVYHSGTPRTEQKLFETEIRKITDFQDQVQRLKHYNDVTVTSP
ncbi:E3 ubiquitin-protein ligase LRSAM1-like isoform X5 [Athalia rosae]|uniref:E3 ubiquitin-protein ligase LRSAM1-like isoform X5 n=1 Tax=Athalia rosae TaxID=37344 RepID=UPI00203434D7|nr:E3 ubiquitin-protein ligase LRSAM1-like isoform X5 [Athalia rosae]